MKKLKNEMKKQNKHDFAISFYFFLFIHKTKEHS